MLNKYYLLLLAITLGHLAGYSQITITQSDFPMVDYTGITGNDTSTAIGTGSAGASQTWDFSAFVPATIDTAFLTATTFAGNPLFPSATFSSCASVSGFNICSYGFINTTGLYLVGVEQNGTFGSTTMHSIVSMEPNNQVISFPFTYTNTHATAYTQHQLSVFTPASPSDSTKATYHRTVDQVCDGWGTLITPYGTYNAIRVQQIQSNIDTSYTHMSGTWTVSSSTPLKYDTSYTWYANGIGSVATISGKAPYRYSFYKASLTTGIASNAGDNISVYPNPVTETLFIDNVTTGTDLCLFDISGRMFYHTTANDKGYLLDMRPYQQGLYLLQMTDVSGYRTTRRIVKQ
jgi:hypothetical protein